MERSKKTDIPFIIGIIILIVLGTASGVAHARLYGKNSLSQHRSIEITLKEDVEVLDLNSQIEALLDSSDGVEPGENKVLLPAGTTGYGDCDIWYYYNAEKDPSCFSLGANFPDADGSFFRAYVSNNPEELGNDNVIDANKIESPESVIAQYNECVEAYRKMWRNHQIIGAAIGFIISGITAAIFLIIHKKEIEKRPPSIHFGILIAIDLILLLNTASVLYLFTRLL